MPSIVEIPRQFRVILSGGRIADFPSAGRYTVDDEIASHPLVSRFVVEDRPDQPVEE